MIRRALLAFLALPGLIAFIVPLWIARSTIRAGTFHWPGLLLLVPGVALLAWCVRAFLVRGKGTLAPWDPPRYLVAHGAYRVSRNPMYLAVVTILAGWAALFASVPLLLYALAIFIAFHLRVVLGEERALARAFGAEWKQYASRAPRWLFRSRRAVVGTWVTILVIVPVAALAYEAYADALDAREFPAPGTLVDIGGRRLHLLCIGRGEPIVFFEMSGFSNALSFTEARDRVAERTTVCSYDRSGMGWSDPAEGPVSAADLARDLAVLQDRAKLHAPYVLAASSIGGLTAELFARQFPERVAGLVLLDAANSITLSQRVLLARWIPPRRAPRACSRISARSG
jgi:protein-S-isoprenylcysteine O-methyltransferase Ste14